MTTTEIIKIDSDGFSCENDAQEDRRCADYEMRACCEGSFLLLTFGCDQSGHGDQTSAPSIFKIALKSYLTLYFASILLYICKYI